MAIRISKKGFIFTTIAIFIIFIMAIIFFAENKYAYRTKSEPVESRIMTMNGFIKDLYNDVNKAGYISTYRSLIAMEDYMSSKGVFFENLSDPFTEVFMYGTINGVEIPVMTNTTFSNYIVKVNRIAATTNINLTMNVTGVSIYHESPWSVVVMINLSIDAYDFKKLAEWHFNKTVLSNVPILDIKDPIYTVNTLGRVPNTIRRFEYAEFINDTNDINDTHILESFINESYYINSTRGPSFLMRYTNNLSNSSFGIESIVDLKEMLAQNSTVDTNKSQVDFIYFSNLKNTGSACNIQNMPGWVKLDNSASSIALYELNEVHFNTSC